MSITTISDTRIRLRPSKELLELLNANKDRLHEIPENVVKVLKAQGYKVPTPVEILEATKPISQPNIDIKLLQSLVADVSIDEMTNERENYYSKPGEENSVELYFYLNDLRWLNNVLTELRRDNGSDVFLHNIIESCDLLLPENEVIARNPELEARCQKLRVEQQNRDYYKMTKNVDASVKHYPEDTVAYQMKMLNSQIIAVLQFVFSVAAGFVFGFLGVALIVGNLDFGFRLLLGIMCALIIALAEIYFLAKKLNEYDDVMDTPIRQNSPRKSKKVHTD